VDRCYPLNVVDNRSLPEGYSDPAFVWDIDKTYLATRFSSPKYMARIPLEFAVDKQAIPGMPQILRGLRRGPGPRFACAPLYFVSASPPQLRKVIERKMMLDAVDFDGITFKDWGATLAQMRPGRLREQVGFKICALLDGRRRRPLAREFLFGDDFEKDAVAYGLYAKILSGELHGDDMLAALDQEGVPGDDADCIRRMREALPSPLGVVEKVFIHLERGLEPESFADQRPLVAPVHGAFQLSLALFALDLVDDRTVTEAASAIRATSVFRRLDLDELMADGVQRGLISSEQANKLPLL
jgi:Phosphatidate phosphatase APP1, catalytic domain